MSHFTTLVILGADKDGKPEESVDAALAPYMENCCGEPDKIYMKFYDEEDEMLKKYQEEGVERVIMPDGRLLLTWDKEFHRAPTEQELKKDPFLKLGGVKEVPANLERRMVPFKETYATFEEFAADWYGRKSRDETYNRYGYWQNPRAKWDWYEIGGRWAGYFQLKPGRKGLQGSQYNMAQHYEKSQQADICKKGDVDWEAMQQQRAEEAGKGWDTVNEVIKDLPVCESWADVLDRHGKENVEAARKEYWAQPRVKACQKEDVAEVIGWLSDVDRFQVTREEYVRRAVESAFVTHAVVKDGKWYEAGEMGYWAMVHGEKDPETWAAMFNQLLKDVPDEEILVLCDCHI